MNQRLFQIILGLLVSGIFSSCAWYKQEVPSNRCINSEQCGKGNACREGRCEDIYFPKRKVRQY